MLPGQLLDDVVGSVHGFVRNDDHLEEISRIVLVKLVADRRFDTIRLVEGGNQNAHSRRTRRGMHGAATEQSRNEAQQGIAHVHVDQQRQTDDRDRRQHRSDQHETLQDLSSFS